MGFKASAKEGFDLGGNIFSSSNPENRKLYNKGEIMKLLV